MNISISVKAVLKGLRAILVHKYALFRVLTVPFILYFLALLLLEYFGASLASQIYIGFVTFGLFVYISVATHRIIILPSGTSKRIGLISFGKREWQFFLAIFEAAFYCLPTILFLFIPYIGEFLATVVSAYIISRISLIYPSIAIDAPMKAGASWKATSNYQLMMFTVVFIFSLLFSTIEYGLSALSVSNVLVGMFSIVTVVLLVGALSEAYKTIMNELDEASVAPEI